MFDDLGKLEQGADARPTVIAFLKNKAPHIYKKVKAVGGLKESVEQLDELTDKMRPHIENMLRVAKKQLGKDAKFEHFNKMPNTSELRVVFSFKDGKERAFIYSPSKKTLRIASKTTQKESVEQIEEKKVSPEDLTKRAMKRIWKDPHDEKSNRVADRELRLAGKLKTKRDMPKAYARTKPKLPEEAEPMTISNKLDEGILDKIKKALRKDAPKNTKNPDFIFIYAGKRWNPPVVGTNDDETGDPIILAKGIKKIISYLKNNRVDPKSVNFYGDEPGGSVSDVAKKHYADLVKAKVMLDDEPRYKQTNLKFESVEQEEHQMENINKLDELTDKQRAEIAARKKKREDEKAAKKAKAAENKAKREKSKGTRGGEGAYDKEDDHVIMQFRKAQDVDGNMDIKFGRNKTGKVSKDDIDAVLSFHDKLSKPDDKRRMRIKLAKGGVAAAKQLAAVYRKTVGK